NARVHPASRVDYLGRKLLELPGRELQALRGAESSMIFQEPMSSLNPVFTVGFQIAEVLRQHRALPASQARLRALQLLGARGRAGRIFSEPQDAVPRGLLACRPPLDRRPQRLPVIDDFVGGTGPKPGERRRGLRGDEPIILEARGLAKSFYFRDGLFGRRELKAVKGASFKLAKGKTLGVVGESR